MGKEILITGGSGFIGSNLALELQKREPEAQITVLEDFRATSFKNLLGFEGDVLTYDVAEKLWLSWAKGRSIDQIYHLASITDTTILDEKKMMYDNVEGFRNILDLAVEKEASLVYASSAAVYGSQNTSMKETDGGKPNNVYGFSKWVMENLAHSYHHKLKVVGLRYFNVFGPREDFKGAAASMIYQLAKQILSGKNPRIFTDGEQKRDFVYVKDVVKATIMAHQSKENTSLNVGTGQATSFNEVIDALNEAFETQMKPDYFENPYSFYQDFTQADMSHHQKMTGFQCDYSTREGIFDYAKNYLLNAQSFSKPAIPSGTE